MNSNLKHTHEINYFKAEKTKYRIAGTLEQVKNDIGLTAIKKRLWVDGIEILPEAGFEIRSFYDCSFDWGRSSGSAVFTSALAICLVIFKEVRIAENLFSCFKEEFVVDFPPGNFNLEINLTDFLRRYKDRLQPDLYSRFCFSSLLNAREVFMHCDPQSGEVTVNLSENYVLHNQCIRHEELRRLSERRQQLLFRFCNQDEYLIKGDDVAAVMARVEAIMSRFYWRSLERILKKQYLDKFG